MHETRYGYSAPAEKAEIVSLRSAVTGLMRKPQFERIAAGGAAPPAAAFRGTRPVYFAEAGRHVDTPTYDRARAGGRQPDLRAGADRGIRLDHRACIRATRSRSMPSAIFVIDDSAELTMDVALKSKPVPSPIAPIR